MQKVTLVRGARQLLTLRGPSGPRRGADLRNLGIIQDGAVLIADGLIVEVGPSRRLENLALARGAQEVDASGCVVLPGFVDGDVHLVKSAHEMSPRRLRILALRTVEEAVRCGTTAMEVKSGLGLTAAEALKILRVYALLRELPMTIVSTFLAGGVDAASRERLVPMVRRRKLAEFIEIVCEAEARPLLALARQMNLGVKVGAGAIGLGVKLGAISVNKVVEVSERDAMLLRNSQTIATLSPAVVFHGEQEQEEQKQEEQKQEEQKQEEQKNDERYAPARLLIDSGAAVTLASGAHQLNMQIPIAVACRCMHMTPAEAISASTINGAHAVGRAASIGSIEAGKSADLVILGIPDYRELPYHFGVNLVNLVMSRGTVLMERSKVKWPAPND
jgi:imidazolonepropionase